jgi:cobalt-zinc-cadmium efflux system protein
MSTHDAHSHIGDTPDPGHIGDTPDPGHSGHHQLRDRALVIALVANGTFLVVELVGAVVFDSLALLADGAHMVSDVVALSIALIAQRLMRRPATARHTFGLQRAEVIGAQANAVLLFAASAWIVFEAVQRIGTPQDVEGTGLLIVAAAGLVVNLVSAVALERHAGHSLNMRGAVLHMTLDAAGSGAALVAGIGIVIWDARLLDPVASIAITVLVLWSAWGLLRDATHVLMEGTPRGLDTAEIERFIAEDPAVEGIHHVHVWNIASDMPALSAHLVISGEQTTLHEAQIEGDRIRARVLERFGIEHTTLELECHACEPDPDHTLH